MRAESRKILAIGIQQGYIDSTCSGAGVLVRIRAGFNKEPLASWKGCAMADTNKDIERIKQLIDIMKENGLVELQIEHDDDKIVLKRAQPRQNINGIPVIRSESFVAPAVPQVSEDVSQPSTTDEEHLIEIKSPIVGTFYATPSPDSEPYVEAGSKVTPQTVVCIIEAMKVMNEIKAEAEGTIVAVLVKNGQAVEYGQVLFTVRPD